MLSFHAAAPRLFRGSGAFRIAAVATLTLLATLATLAAPPLRAQAATDSRIPTQTEGVRLSGPRFGITLLTGAMRDSLKANGIEVGPVITQFGWQFEKQFLGQPGGVVAVNEWIVLVGGLDQGAFLPSVSWIVGVRGQGGAEFGIGPNLSAAGVGLVAAAGVTYRAGTMNIPLNFAVVPSSAGARVSILSGFTLNK